jgi:hypothetical protein
MRDKGEDRPSLIANRVEAIERFVPLGLTAQEARAWYQHQVIMPCVTRGLLALATGSALVIPMVTPLSAYLESTLTLHMIVQHSVFIGSGFLLAYSTDSLMLAASRVSNMIAQTYATLAKANAAVNKHGMLSFVSAVLLTAYWQIPGNFNAALLNEPLHFEMHLTFLLVGGVTFVGAMSLSKRIREIAPIIVGKALGLFGTFLLLTSSYVYTTYPFSEQSQVGTVMIVMMLVMDLTIAPYWLYGYFGNRPLTSSLSKG